MNHPSDEQWLAYLDGETSGETERQLTQHLEQCPQCAAEVEGWRQSIDHLRRLDWPAAPAAGLPGSVARPSRVLAPARWAAAAALVLGLGFALGRFTGPDPDQLREAIAAELKAHEQSIALRLSGDIAEAAARSRAEHRQELVQLVAELQRQQAADYLSLRKDLETVASVAEAGLRRTDWRLTEIAAIHEPQHTQ